jgi:hypothetical protein
VELPGERDASLSAKALIRGIETPETAGGLAHELLPLLLPDVAINVTTAAPSPLDGELLIELKAEISRVCGGANG